MGQELFNYDNTNLEEVIQYSEKILNRKFSDILKEYDEAEYKTYDDFQNQEANEYEKKEIKPSSKGSMGIISNGISLDISLIVMQQLTLKKLE